MPRLEAKHIDTIRPILARLAPQCEVWAFGSRVHGRNLKKFSDLDLAVIAAEPLGASRIFALKEAFSESYLPIQVDVLDWATASPQLRGLISREHEVIQSRQGGSRRRGDADGP